MRWFVFVLLSACSLSQGGAARFENVDLLGSTIEHEVTQSEARCAGWCEPRQDCLGYTFATSGKNKGRCYLKKAGFRFNPSKGYNSGIKR